LLDKVATSKLHHCHCATKNIEDNAAPYVDLEVCAVTWL